jgi:hypothetical protein
MNTEWWHATGRRWHRPPQVCPDWCGGGHHCTAEYGGEHRSVPLRIARPWGVLVATRTQSVSDPASRIEVRLQARLSPDEDLAHVEAARIAEEIDTAVRVALATAVGWMDVDELHLFGLSDGGGADGSSGR